MTFFSDIQTKFSQKFEGRYLGHIIEAISVHHPHILQPLLPREMKVGRTQLRCSTEYCYGGLAKTEIEKRRFADLAIFVGDTFEPCVLVEIKAEDYRNSDHNDAQLNDYIKWATKNAGRRVVVLTQYLLPESTKRLVNANRNVISVMTFQEFDALVNKSTQNSELIQLFHEYLQEKGLIMHEFDGADLEALLTFMNGLLLPNRAGQRQVNALEKVMKGPVAFANLMHNVKLAADGLQANHYATAVETNRKPKLVFYTAQGFSKGTILAEKGDYEDWRAPRVRKAGGSVFVCTSEVITKFGKSSQLYVDYGLELTVKAGKKNRGIEIWPYAQLFVTQKAAANVWSWKYGRELRSIDHKGVVDRKTCSAISDLSGLQKRIKHPLVAAAKSSLVEARKLPDAKLAKVLTSKLENLVAALES